MTRALQTVTVACNQCGSRESRVVAVGGDREYPDTTSDLFSVVECVRCGLRYLNPRPAVSELAVIYPARYHAYNVRRPAAALTLVTRVRHRLYGRRFRRPLRYLAGHPRIDLLDVGCGDGWMLDLYRMAAADRIATHGVDFQEDVCAIARAGGHTVYCGRFEDLDLPSRFDLVNLSHVIEHVADPPAFVGKAWEVLRPGGIFVIETPNTDTLDWRWFREGAWGAYHIPRHWTFYDPGSLRRLGERAGFILREMAFHPAPVHWVWSFHNVALARRGALAAAARRVFAPLDVFRGGPKALALLAVFSALDLLLLGLTGRTSNMMAVFQKPAA
jgi:SAM-dependent methyltransferase